MIKKVEKMNFNKKLVSLSLVLGMQISYAAEDNYPIIDPLNEISITQKALRLLPSDEQMLIDFSFHPEKQTGQNQVFKGDELKKIELKNFEPVNVVKILYPFEIIEIGDHNLDKKIFNFLKSKFYKKCDCVDGKKLVEQNIFVRVEKVIKFKNINNENRFLLPVEVWKVYGEGREAFFSNPKLELYLFKKIENNRYQLVTRTPINYEGIGLYESREGFPSEANLKELASNIRLIGTDRIGSFFKINEFRGGAKFADWNILSLKEDEFIRSYLASSASEDTHEMFYRSHPHKYDSKLTIIPVKGKSYYPIKIQYKGNRFSKSKYKLEDKNQTNILEFDPRLRIYSYDESTMQRILLDESNK